MSKQIKFIVKGKIEVELNCCKCNKSFDIYKNSNITIRKGYETLIIVCPYCKTEAKKVGNKIDYDINKVQITMNEVV